MDQCSRAEVGGKADQPAHDVGGARAHSLVGAGDRQALGRDKQPVQARAFDAGVGVGAPDFGTAAGRQQVRFVVERERRHLQAIVADGGGKDALRREIHLADHFVT